MSNERPRTNYATSDLDGAIDGLLERSERPERKRGTAPATATSAAQHTARLGPSPSERDAEKAWQQAESKMAEGRLSDPRRGRQTFRRYVTEEWLPHHVIEATTREAYTYQIGKHILPWFGPMRMNEIMPSHVREWVTDLQAKGVSPATHPEGPVHPQRDLHHRAGRRDLPAPVQGRQDAHRPEEATQDHHPGAVRCDL